MTSGTINPAEAAIALHEAVAADNDHWLADPAPNQAPSCG